MTRSFDKLAPTYGRSNINIDDELNSDLPSEEPLKSMMLKQQEEEESDVDPRLLWKMLHSD